MLLVKEPPIRAVKSVVYKMEMRTPWGGCLWGNSPSSSYCKEQRLFYYLNKMSLSYQWKALYGRYAWGHRNLPHSSPTTEISISVLQLPASSGLQMVTREQGHFLASGSQGSFPFSSTPHPCSCMTYCFLLPTPINHPQVTLCLVFLKILSSVISKAHFKRELCVLPW